MTDRQSFSTRLIDLAGMDKNLRRALLVSYAILLGLSLAAALKQILPGPDVVASPGIRLQSAAVLVAGIALLAAIYFVLSGAAQLRSAWRFALALPVAWVGLTMVFAQPEQGLRDWSVAPGVLFVAASMMIMALGPRPDANAPVTRVAILAGLLAAFVVANVAMGSTYYTPTLVMMALGFLAMPLSPALMTVGYDLGEAAALSVAPLLKRIAVRNVVLRSIGRGTALAAVAALAYWMASGLERFETADILARVTLLAVFAAVAVWALWSRTTPGAGEAMEIGYWRIFALAAAILAIESLAALFPIAAPGIHNYEGVHQFSIHVPGGWSFSQRLARPGPDLDGDPRVAMRRVLERAPDRLPRIVVMATIGPSFARPGERPALVNDVEGMRAIEPLEFVWNKPDFGRWRHGEQTATIAKSGKKLRMLYWRTDIRAPSMYTDKSWFVACAIPPDSPAEIESDCRSVVTGLRYYQRTVHDPWAEFWFNQVYWFAFAATGLLVLRIRGRSDPFLWMAVWCAMVLAVRNFGIHGVGIQDILRDRDLMSGLCASVLLFAAGATAAAFAVATVSKDRRWRAARDVAVSFSVTVSLLTAAYLAYTVAAQGSNYSDEIRGAILCLGVTWELWTSGSTVTNHDGSRAPRSARVRMFAGYLILVSAATFFFTGMKIDYDDSTVEGWDADGLAMSGLCTLGFAYAFMRHAERLTGILPARKRASAPSETPRTP